MRQKDWAECINILRNDASE